MPWNGQSSFLQSLAEATAKAEEAFQCPKRAILISTLSEQELNKILANCFNALNGQFSFLHYTPVEGNSPAYCFNALNGQFSFLRNQRVNWYSWYKSFRGKRISRSFWESFKVSSRIS